MVPTWGYVATFGEAPFIILLGLSCWTWDIAATILLLRSRNCASKLLVSRRRVVYVFPDIYGLLLSRIVAREPCCCYVEVQMKSLFLL